MKNKQKKRVYCSGPLFCPEEIALMSAISDELENAGYETFLPHRDGLEPYIMKTINNPHVTNKKFRHINNFISKAIFAMDLYQVVYGCDYLVFNMNGRVPDEGGVVETAVAFASGKPLVIYKNDYRSKFNGNDNSMLTGLSFTFNYAKKIKDIPEMLEKIAKQINSLGLNPYKGENVPPAMRKTLDIGEKIWLIKNKFESANSNHFEDFYVKIQNFFD